MLTNYFGATEGQRAAADRFFQDCGIPELHHEARAASDALLAATDGEALHRIAINMIKYDGTLLQNMIAMELSQKVAAKLLRRAMEVLRLHYEAADALATEAAATDAG
jgi:hypothetical protein